MYRCRHLVAEVDTSAQDECSIYSYSQILQLTLKVKEWVGEPDLVQHSPWSLAWTLSAFILAGQL